MEIRVHNTHHFADIEVRFTFLDGSSDVCVSLYDLILLFLKEELKGEIDDDSDNEDDKNKPLFPLVTSDGEVA